MLRGAHTDLAGASVYTALALRRTLDALASNEQRSYIEDIRQMNSAAEKRGISPAYWGPDYLLLSLSLLRCELVVLFFQAQAKPAFL